jgi:hypothetical protein
LPLLDSYVPICKEEYEKNLAANEEILNKAIDEVVAKQLDLGIDISMSTLVEHSHCTLLILIDFCPVKSELLTWSSVY